MWKTAFCLGRPYHFKFLKAVFHKVFLVHSWILCFIWKSLKVFFNEYVKSKSYVNFINFHFFPDCCQVSTEGIEDFKGVYNFESTLVGSIITNPCKYNPNSSYTRMCMPDLENGPSWEDADFNNCSTKYPVTNELFLLVCFSFCVFYY